MSNGKRITHLTWSCVYIERRRSYCELDCCIYRYILSCSTAVVHLLFCLFGADAKTKEKNLLHIFIYKVRR